jgi:CelD/BcsL family acetyltransferase involved in cellulose biosynthesis
MKRILKLDAQYPSIEASCRDAVPTRICVSNELSDFADLWPRTNRLGVARCYPFQCADMLELQWDSFFSTETVRPLFIAILGHSDEPLALLPLSIEDDYHYFGRIKPVRLLKFLDGGFCDYNAPVLFPPAADWDMGTVRMIWTGLRKVLPAFDLAVFEKMPDRVADLPNPFSLLKTKHSVESCHAAQLTGTWEDFSGKLPSRHSWRTRRFQALGRLSFEIAETAGQYDHFIEALIRQKRRRSLETGGRGAYEGHSGRVRYLTGARRLVYPSGPVCVFALRINDVIVATVFGLLLERWFIGLGFGYEGGDWRAYSLGHLLLNKVVEWCFEKEVSVFDFGIGDEAYKSLYCDAVISLGEAKIPTTIRGRVALCSSTLATRARERRARSRDEMGQAQALCADRSDFPRAAASAWRSVVLWPSPRRSLQFLNVAKRLARR